MAESEQEKFVDSDEDSSTTSTRTRWEWTATIVALSILLALPVIVVFSGLGILALGQVTQAWFLLYSTVALMSAVWLFGEDTLLAVKEYRGD